MMAPLRRKIEVKLLENFQTVGLTASCGGYVSNCNGRTMNAHSSLHAPIVSICLLSICALAQSGSIEAALSSHQFDQALVLIREALQNHRKTGVADAGRHRARQTGKKPEALEAFNRALTVAPNNLAALEGAASGVRGKEQASNPRC